MSKRKRFVLTSIILSSGFIAMSLLGDANRFAGIGALSFLTIILFSWSLREGLKFNLVLLSLILPTMFTFGVGLFWFLLPSGILTRIPVAAVYGIGIYALCLTSNIFTVSAIRTIALLRAARGVGFVLSLLTCFLIFDTILSLKTGIFQNIFFISLTSFGVLLQGLWTFTLEDKMSKKLLFTLLILTLIMAEVSAALYFWPVTVVVGSLYLTASQYMLLGLGQAWLEERLFSQTVREYLYVGAAVLFGMFMATRWGV